MKKLLTATTLAACLLAIACSHSAAIWVVNGSTSSALQFGIGKTRGSSDRIWSLTQVQVAMCAGPNERPGDRVMWIASGDASSDGRSGTFKYASPPAGLTNKLGPGTLVAGCYVATIRGSGVAANTCFEIDAQGAVTDAKPSVVECQTPPKAE